MKRTALLLTLIGSLGLTQAALAGSRAPDFAFAGEGVINVAQFSAEEREQLRQRWLDLRPEEREALRQQMLEKQRRMRDRASEMSMEPSRYMPGFGFGQGFEQRRDDDRYEDRHDDRYEDRYDDRRRDREDDSRRRGRR